MVVTPWTHRAPRMRSSRSHTASEGEYGGGVVLTAVLRNLPHSLLTRRATKGANKVCEYHQRREGRGARTFSRLLAPEFWPRCSVDERLCSWIEKKTARVFLKGSSILGEVNEGEGEGCGRRRETQLDVADKTRGGRS